MSTTRIGSSFAAPTSLRSLTSIWRTDDCAWACDNSACCSVKPFWFGCEAEDRLAAWAFKAAREAGAQIESATVGTAGEGGRVNAEFVFKR